VRHSASGTAGARSCSARRRGDLELATLPARRTLPQRELTLASGQAFTIQSDRHSFSDMLVDQAIFDAEKQPLVAFCATSSRHRPRETWLQVHSRATKLAELPLLITVAGYLALTAISSDAP
jgi:hypothetical protein